MTSYGPGVGVDINQPQSPAVIYDPMLGSSVASTFDTPSTVTMTKATPGVISWAAHGLPAGTGIKFATTGALYTGLVAGTEVFVSSAGLASGSFQVADTYAHAIAGTNSNATSGSQSGVQTVYAVHSTLFTPFPLKPFNISLWGTFAGSVQLERSFDGLTFLPVTAAGTQLCIWTAPASESWEEDMANVFYRLNNTVFTSGTLNYLVNQ
jgi:hypothetical protein